MWQAERAEAEAEEQRQAAAAAAAQQKKKQKKKRAAPAPAPAPAPALGLPPAGAAPLPSSGRVDTAAIEAQTRTQMCASAPKRESVEVCASPDSAPADLAHVLGSGRRYRSG